MCGTPAGKDSSESVRNAVLRLGEMGPHCRHVTLRYGPAPGGTEDRLPCGLSGGLRISRKHPLITPKSKWEFQPFYSRRGPLGNNHPPGRWPTCEDWPFLVSSGHMGSQRCGLQCRPPSLSSAPNTPPEGTFSASQPGSYASLQHSRALQAGFPQQEPSACSAPSCSPPTSNSYQVGARSAFMPRQEPGRPGSEPRLCHQGSMTLAASHDSLL